MLLMGLTNCDSSREHLQGCESTGYRFVDQNVVLMTDVQTEETPADLVYVFPNTSVDPVIVDRQFKTRPGASAGWSSQLTSSLWSILKTNERDLEFYCLQKKNDNFVPVSCQSVIQVCQIPLKLFEETLNEGNYWVHENISFREAKHSIR